MEIIRIWLINGKFFAASIEYDRTNWLSNGQPLIAQFLSFVRQPGSSLNEARIGIRDFIGISGGSKADQNEP